MTPAVVEVAPYWMRVSTGPIAADSNYVLCFMAGYKADWKYRLRVLDGDGRNIEVERIMAGGSNMGLSGTLASFEAIVWELPPGVTIMFNLKTKEAVENLVVQLEDAP